MFNELHDDLKKMQSESKKINEDEYAPGSYLSIIKNVNRYTIEAQTAINAARTELETVKNLGSYKASEQVKQMVDVIEKSLGSMSKVVIHAISSLKKLGG